MNSTTSGEPSSKTTILTDQFQNNNCQLRKSHCIQKLSVENQFPLDEEPNILGHGANGAVPEESLDANNVVVRTTESVLGKYKVLLNFEDAPDHLKFNPYIRSGYRTFLSTKHCFQSIFWWTNETINIWSHLFGYLLFLGLTITDFKYLKAHADFGDQIVLICLVVCFQACMLLSTVYHIFSCRSEKHYDLFLSVDFFGISLSLIAIYISGMYYAFWCQETLRNIYSTIAIGIFIVAMCTMIPKLNVSLNTRIIVLFLWAVYGVIPLGHWAIVMGGLQNPLVQLLVPRVVMMYLLCGIAFVIYATQIPERWFSGKVDYCGHSHNWWHLFILAALYHWHNTGILYAEFRLANTCSMVQKYM